MNPENNIKSEKFNPQMTKIRTFFQFSIKGRRYLPFSKQENIFSDFINQKNNF